MNPSFNHTTYTANLLYNDIEEMEKIQLESRFTDKELNQQLGKFYDGGDMELIDRDVDAYEGDKFIFKLRKGVLRNDIIPDYKDVTFKFQNNRGVSAGPLIEEELKKKIDYDFKIIRDFKYVRVKKDGSLSGYFLSNPVRSNIIGYFDYINYYENGDGTKSQIRNIKTTANTTEKSLDSLEELTKSVDKIYKENMSEIYKETKKNLDDKGFQEYLYKDCLTTTITVNTDFRTALHKDKNNYNKVGVMAVLSSTENHFTGGELILPRYNVKINVAPGDVIIFNSDEYHTNAPIVGDGRYSFVFYIRQNIVKVYDENLNKNIERCYLDDLFLDYNKPCLIVKDTKDKEKIIECHKKTGYPIYKMASKTSFNQRAYGDVKIRYINKTKEKLFKNAIYINNIDTLGTEVIQEQLEDLVIVDNEEILLPDTTQLPTTIKKSTSSNIKVCVISHLRTESVMKMTALLNTEIFWYVGKNERESYMNAGAINVIEGGGLCESRNRALEDAFSNNEICVQVSDDLSNVKKLYKNEEEKWRGRDIPFMDVVNIMNHQGIIDDTKLVGVAPTSNPFFCASGLRVKNDKFIVGDMIMVFPTHLRFDTQLRLKEDYDYTSQHILEYGKVSRMDDYMFGFAHRKNKGGACAVRTSELEQESIKYLRDKFGQDVFIDNKRRKEGNEVLFRPNKLTKIFEVNSRELPLIINKICVKPENSKISITIDVKDLELLEKILKENKITYILYKSQ